jgi:hypothetical protein
VLHEVVVNLESKGSSSSSNCPNGPPSFQAKSQLASKASEFGEGVGRPCPCGGTETDGTEVGDTDLVMVMIIIVGSKVNIMILYSVIDGL